MSRVRVFFHDKCFDGAASAAVFSSFFRQRFDAGAQFEYSGLTHKASGLFESAEFTGDENVIVDFKYSPDPRVTWWFDHHQSAFLTPEDAKHFAQDHSGQKFYDPNFRSCTSFIAYIAHEHFGFDPTQLKELIHWADVIDGAAFESAAAAVEMREPAMQLTLVIEASRQPDLMQRIILDFTRMSLKDLVAQNYIQREFRPLFDRHKASIAVIRAKAEYRDGVVYFDLTDEDLEGYNKFIPYYLYPEAVYSVGLSRSAYRTKVSVGSSPWATTNDIENLATLCERYGGGGHARVGAISFPPGDVEPARQAAREIVAHLRDSFRAKTAVAP